MDFSKDNEILEGELTRVRGELVEIRANKRKLEKVLQDSAAALKQALRVGVNYEFLVICDWAEG